MASVESAVIARMHKGKDLFEILVDSKKALDFKLGKPYSIENILAVNNVFKDAKKGERASSADMQKCFGTADVFRVAEHIIKDGEVQVTTEERRKMVEEKRKEIADIISRQGIDPKTKLPHPVQRILNAMDQARVQIDPFRPAREQTHGIIPKLQEVIPISIQTAEIAVKIPVQYASRAVSAIRSMAAVKSEEWKTDYWYGLIEIPAGMQSQIYDRLNELTAGNVEVKVLKMKDV
jgi:ribosome maturation protein SDO1